MNSFEVRLLIRTLTIPFSILVPTKTYSRRVKEFRPISLVISLYKILPKDLANRLSEVWGVIISTNQVFLLKEDKFCFCFDCRGGGGRI